MTVAPIPRAGMSAAMPTVASRATRYQSIGRRRLGLSSVTEVSWREGRSIAQAAGTRQCHLTSDRQRPRILDLRQREAGLDRAHTLDPRQFLAQEDLVGSEIRADHAQQIVELSGHQIALHHLRPVGDGIAEAVELIRALLLYLYRDEHRDRQPHRSLVDGDAVGGNDPGLFHVADAAQAG